MRFLMLILCFLLSLGCARQAQLTDKQADEKLGLVQAEDKDDAEDALKQIQEMQIQEQKRNLERQITDPLTSSNR